MGNKALNKTLFLGTLVVLMGAFARAEVSVVVVEDLDDRSNDSTFVVPESTVLEDSLYFLGNDGIHGFELWRTDGTAGGTEMVRDQLVAAPYALEASGAGSLELVTHDGAVYYQGHDAYIGGSGWEPWRSDGTTAGTNVLRDVAADPAHPSSYPYNFSSTSDYVYFVAGLAYESFELWRSDGTEAGTLRVKEDLAPLFAGNAPDYELIALQTVEMEGVTYFFGVNDGTRGYQLWKTLGTPETTELIKEPVGISVYALFREPDYLWPTVVGDQLFFKGWDADHGFELWVSDGTTEGTVRVADTVPGEEPRETKQGPVFLERMGDALLFFSGVIEREGPLPGYGLWKSDGTPAGTSKIADVNPAWGSSHHRGTHSGFPYRYTERVGDALYFIACDAAFRRYQLWKTDGTPEGTVMVKDSIREVSDWGSEKNSGWFTERNFHLTAVGDLLYFAGHTAEHGWEVWRSDGTEAGTYMLKDVYPGSRGGLTAFGGDDDTLNNVTLTNLNDQLVFAANDGAHGIEWWKSDGTAEGTRLIRDINQTTKSDQVASLVTVGDQLFFRGFDHESGRELWVVDEFALGAKLVSDLTPGEEDSVIMDMVAFDGRLVFTLEGSEATHLWSSDGTPEGTYAIESDIGTIFRDEDPYRPWFLTPVGDTLYFMRHDDAHGYELWRTDGSLGGASMVSDARPGAFPEEYEMNGIGWMAAFNDQVLLSMEGDSLDTPVESRQGRELWISDGTEEGTRIVRDIWPGDRDSSPSVPTVVGSRAFFGADDGETDEELWVTDGTPEGTYRVAELNSIHDGFFSSKETRGVALGDRYLFTGADDAHGWEPWISDGTEEGTFMLADLVPGEDDSLPQSFVRWGSEVFFSASDTRLYRTDGTPEGTVEVSANGGFGFTPYAGHLYYTSFGEVWRTDGTAAGTEQVAELWPGDERALPEAYALAGGRLYFVGNHPDYDISLMTVIESSQDVALAAARILNRFNTSDADNNGVLEFEEARVALPGLTAALFERLDVNENGSLELTELLGRLSTEGEIGEGEGEDGEGAFEGSVEGGIEGARDGEGGVFVAHAADVDASGAIDLDELLRMVQFFNRPVGYACGGNEDGYVVDATTPRDCTPHSADSDEDWKLSFSELLRVVQLFNAAGYRMCPGSEDGYCPMTP